MASKKKGNGKAKKKLEVKVIREFVNTPFFEVKNEKKAVPLEGGDEIIPPKAFEQLAFETTPVVSGEVRELPAEKTSAGRGRLEDVDAEPTTATTSQPANPNSNIRASYSAVNLEEYYSSRMAGARPKKRTADFIPTTMDSELARPRRLEQPDIRPQSLAAREVARIRDREIDLGEWARTHSDWAFKQSQQTDPSEDYRVRYQDLKTFEEQKKEDDDGRLLKRPKKFW